MLKNPLVNEGDMGSICGSRRSPGEGNDQPLPHSCLENSVDRGVWQATIHGGPKRARHDFVTEQQHRMPY